EQLAQRAEVPAEDRGHRGVDDEAARRDDDLPAPGNELGEAARELDVLDEDQRDDDHTLAGQVRPARPACGTMPPWNVSAPRRDCRHWNCRIPSAPCAS